METLCTGVWMVCLKRASEEETGLSWGADGPLVQEVSGEPKQAGFRDPHCCIFSFPCARVALTTRVCLQCRMECCDVPAETLYDVLHDIEYRRKWDSNVIETFDIARLTVNADVGYYSCEQAQDKTPTPQHPSPPPPSLPCRAARRPTC